MKTKKALALVLGAVFSLSMLIMSSCAGNPDGPNDPGPRPEDTTKYTVSIPDGAYYLLADATDSLTISPVVKANKEIIPDAVCTYRTSDPAVVTVDERGVVKAASYGTATVTATYTAPSGKSASDHVSVKVFTEATAEEVNSFDEKFVNLYGRMDEGEGVVNIDNVGSGIEVAFYGTEIKAKFTVTAPMYGRVFIDGEMQEFAPIASGDGIVLAENLEEGVHTVAVHKSSEIDEGRLTVEQFYADRFLRIPEKSALKMEFIGDSITCGYGALELGVSGASRSIENSDGCVSYAFLTGKMLEADFSVISYSGICVKADRWGSGFSMTDLHTYTSLQTKKPYSYDADMDAVVLNLGTNDASYITDKQLSYRKQFPADYKAFLTHLREVYPDAYIVCIYGMMGISKDIDSGIKQAIEEMSDAKISYKGFPGNNAGVNGHPYYTAHASYAQQLASYIETLLAE